MFCKLGLYDVTKDTDGSLRAFGPFSHLPRHVNSKLNHSIFTNGGYRLFSGYQLVSPLLNHGNYTTRVNAQKTTQYGTFNLWK